MPGFKRKFTQTAGSAVQRRPAKRLRPRTQRGIVPTYPGWNPRQFALGEWKFKDFPWVNTTIDWNGAVACINGLQLGTSAVTRVGMKVAFRTIEFRIDSYAGAAGIDSTIRCIVFLDKQANGADPGATAALTVGALLQGGEVRSPRNLSNRNRFKILFDKAWTVSAVGKDNANKCYKKYARFSRPIVTEYNAGNIGDITDIATNAIHVAFISTVDSAAAANTKPEVYPYFRLRYTDN